MTERAFAAFRHPKIRAVFLAGACESTQAWAKQSVHEHPQLPDGSLFIAGEQTKGRGRQGRSWHSPRGGLWCSLLLKPSLSAEQSQALAATASLGILEGVRHATGTPVKLKWPNDVLLNGKKLAGILTETSFRGPKLEWAVIGIGLNVNNPLPGELAGIAARLASDNEVLDLEQILNSLLNGFFGVYERFLKEGFANLRTMYLNKMEGIGSPVKIESGGKTYCGIATNVDHQGRLLVKLGQQKTRPFSSSEAHLI